MCPRSDFEPRGQVSSLVATFEPQCQLSGGSCQGVSIPLQMSMRGRCRSNVALIRQSRPDIRQSCGTHKTVTARIRSWLEPFSVRTSLKPFRLFHSRSSARREHLQRGTPVLRARYPCTYTTVVHPLSCRKTDRRCHCRAKREHLQRV